MKVTANVEIHFYQQKEVSVFLETYSPDPESEQFGEIFLFCCTTIRMLSNLGRNDSVALAILLESFDDINKLKDSVKYHNPRTAKLVDYKGTPGRKRFLINSIVSDEKTGFDFKAKGFGIFAKGINYYGPEAVIAFLRFLVKKHIESSDYLINLSTAVSLCRDAYKYRQIKLTNHVQLAMEIISVAFKE